MKMNKMNKGKLLAALAVFAMVACVFAVIPIAESDAAAPGVADDGYGPLNFDNPYEGKIYGESGHVFSNEALGNMLSVEWDAETKTYTITGIIAYHVLTEGTYELGTIEAAWFKMFGQTGWNAIAYEAESGVKFTQGTKSGEDYTQVAKPANGKMINLVDKDGNIVFKEDGKYDNGLYIQFEGDTELYRINVDGVTLATAGENDAWGNGYVVFTEKSTASKYMIIEGDKKYYANSLTDAQNYITKNTSATYIDISLVDEEGKEIIEVSDLSSLATNAGKIVFLNRDAAAGSDPVDLPADTQLVAAPGVNISGSFNIASDTSSITMQGGTYTGTIANGDNEIVAEKLAGNFSITQGSVAIVGTITGGTINEIEGDVKISGTVDGNVTITLVDETTKVTLMDGLTIAEGYELEFINSTGGKVKDLKVQVAKGATVTNNGTIDLADALFTVSGTVVGKGAITGSGEGTFELASSGIVGPYVEITTPNISGKMEDVEISGTTTGSIEFPVYQNVIVPEGETLTIKTENVITILGNLEVLGNLVIQDGGKLVLGEAGSSMKKATADFIGTVDINEGAILQIDNSDVVMNGALKVEGTISVNGSSTLIVNDDSTISETGTLATDATGTISVGFGSSLTVEGYLGTGTAATNISVLGNLTIDNADCEVRTGAYNDVAVSLIAEGATVTIESFLFETTSAQIVINDVGLELFKKDKVSYVVSTTTDTVADNGVFEVDADNEITISISSMTNVEAGKGMQFDGAMTVVAEISKETIDGETTVSNILNISSDVANASVPTFSTVDLDDIAIAIDGQGAETPAINSTTYYADGRIQVPVDSTLKVDVDMDITMTGDVIVAGYMDMTVEDVIVPTVAATTDDKLTVTGELKIFGATGLTKTNGVINAVHFVTEEGADKDEYQVYTSFNNAVVEVLDATNLNEDKTVDIHGTIIVTESVDVASPVEVEVTDDAISLQIGEETATDVLVTMKAGAIMVSDSTKVNVYGSLLFDDKTDDETIETLSDVLVTDPESKNGSKLYTNIYDAMDNAVSGETVEVTRIEGYVSLKSDLTVKEGVTLYVPEDVASLKLGNGVTLTVDGILKSEEDIKADNKFANVAMNVDREGTTEDNLASAIIVNGALMTPGGFTYTNGTATTGTSPSIVYASLAAGAPIAGAYYQIEDYYVVSALEIAISNIADIESNITVNGPVVAVAPVVVGDENYECKKIIVSGTMVDDVTTLTVDTDIKTSLTVAFMSLQDIIVEVQQYGIINGTFTAGADSVVPEKINGDATNLFTITEIDDGLVIYGAAKKTTEGTTDPKEISSFIVSAGTVELGTNTSGSANTFVYDGTVTVDATADVKNVNMNGTVPGSILVNGTLLVGEGVTSASVGTMTVLGTLEVFPGTDSKAAAALNVTNIFVGIEKDDVTSAGAVATVSGPVAPTGYAVVLAGSSVDDVALEEFGDVFTEYYIEGALWITVYNCGGNPEINDFNNAPIEDAYFSGWLNENGEDVKDTDKVGTDAKKVTADITYEVYKVFVIVNPGFANVYIDGQQMNYGALPVESYSDNGGYKYGYFLTVAAGDHTITYDLSNGWSGEAKMTVNGAPVLGGLGFTAAGTPGETADGGIEYIVYNIQLSGLEKSGYVDPVEPSDDKDSGMGLTDYLLIVLVVLVVILAILVALRMMRS